MAFSRTHSATADATFSTTGATNWNAAHALTEAVSGGIPYGTSTTTESYSALLAANALVIGGGEGAAPFTDTAVNYYSGADGKWLLVGGTAPVIQTGDTATRGISISVATGKNPYLEFNINSARAGNVFGSTTAITLSGSVVQSIGLVPRGGSGESVYIGAIGAGSAPVAGIGMYVAAGTAITDVSKFSITGTNNNSAVGTTVPWVSWDFTDTTSNAAALAFRIRGGASATTNLFKVDKAGVGTFGSSLSTGSTITSGGGVIGTTYLQSNTDGVYVAANAAPGVVFGASNATNISWISNGLLGVGTGAAGSIAGGIQLASIGLSSGHIADSATAPSIASGFGTSPSISANNGTAAFTLTIGTATTGVTGGTITMPAATTGWVCHCENVTTPDSFIVSQTGGTTTTIVLKNYSRTTGLATDFTASDVIRIFARGY